ncbi:MAG: hypothetical protein Q7U75_10535 [Desulfobacterales bacterium]|nr:hypothetical protein [Desulfobacterales bacterium]
MWLAVLALGVFLATVAVARAEGVVIPPAITNALARDIVRDLHPSGLRNAHVLASKSMAGGLCPGGGRDVPRSVGALECGAHSPEFGQTRGVVGDARDRLHPTGLPTI